MSMRPNLRAVAFDVQRGPRHMRLLSLVFIAGIFTGLTLAGWIAGIFTS